MEAAGRGSDSDSGPGCTIGQGTGQLCGSNDLMFTPLSSGESVQIEALTPDGKAFLALVEEEYAK